jgi:hypothetical protein
MSVDLAVPNPLNGAPQAVQDQNGNTSSLFLATDGTVAIVGPGSQGATATLTMSTYQYQTLQWAPDVQIVATDQGNANAILSFNLLPATPTTTVPLPGTALNPVLTLSYSGAVTMPALGSLPASGTADLTIDANGNVTPQTSSARFKENIEPLRDDFEKLLLLQPRSFVYRETGDRGIGYTAEEVAQAGLDNLVAYDADGRPLSVHYKMLSVYLLELVRSQGRQIEALRAEVAGVSGRARPVDA